MFSPEVSNAEPPSFSDNLIALPAADQWMIKGSDVSLANPEPGILTIDYHFKIEKTFTVGHLTFSQATSQILLKTPIPMKANDLRILYECRGIERERNRSGKLQVLPIIRDASREIFVCEPTSYPHLKTGTKNWALWMTSYLHAGEAGGPTQNVYQTKSPGNGWPDEPLEFLGFEIQVRGKMGETLSGQFALGNFGFANLKVPSLPPFVYADSLLDNEKGDFTFEAEAATEFQGLPAYDSQTSFSYNGDSLTSRKQRLVFPTGPEGNYWTSYRLRDENDVIQSGETVNYRVDFGDQNPSSKIASGQSRTIQIATIGKIPGVVQKGDKWGVSVTIAKLEKADHAVLEWQLLPANYPNILTSGKLDILDTPAKQWLDLPPFPERDAFRLQAELKVDGKVIDQVTFYLGRSTDIARPYEGRKGVARLRDEVKSSAYFRTTFRPEYNAKSEEAVLTEFHAYLKQATQMARDITIMVDAADLEVLPGVFDFPLLDRMMDAAADYGAGVTIRLAHSDAHATYLWPKLDRQRNFDGGEIYHHFYGNYSPYDPVLQALWKRANRAFYDRYKTHPAFQGYYVMQPAGESVVLDQPWLANISGYSKYARIAFQKYLQENMSLTLQELNKRWSSDFQDWSEVDVPMPDFSLRTKPDLRPQWLDFQHFKSYVDKVGWFLELTKDIRSYDSDRVMIVYSWDLDPLKQLVDYSHGGGVPEGPGHGEDEKYWLENQVGAIQESIHPHRWAEPGDPGDRGWLLDWDLYTMFSRAGGGGMNLHIYYYPIEDIVNKFGGVYAFDRFQKFKPIFNELHQAKLLTPLNKQVAVIQDPLTLFSKHRTTFGHRSADLRRWFEVLIASGAEYEKFRPNQIAQYRLILPNLLDEVMSRETIQTLSDFLKRGGKTIIAANTGLYDDVPGDKPFPLLRTLGIEPPTTSYQTTRRDIKARFIPGASPLTDSLSTLEFYTGEKQKQEAGLPWNFADFKQWPYRWLPETDYFGYYPDHHPKNDGILAKFPDGGTALSLHRVGKGEVLVFWGTPDYRDPSLQFILKRALGWAGVTDETASNPIPLMMEASNERLKRHYVILWEDKPGHYTQRFPFAPNGKLFIEELVSDQRVGIFDGKTLRDNGLELNFEFGYSPLKVLRLQTDIPDWAKRFYQSGSKAVQNGE